MSRATAPKKYATYSFSGVLKWLDVVDEDDEARTIVKPQVVVK
jgi:hypothetical protein